MKDGRGNEITTNNVECMVLINKFEDAVISYEGEGNEYLKKAVEADPSCPYANTLSALFSIFEGNLEKADKYLSTSLSLLSQSSLREKLYYHSVSSFRNSQQLQSLDYHLRIASLFPTDVFNVKIGQIHCLLTGNKEKTLEIPFTALSQTSSNFYLLYQNPSFTPLDDHLHLPSRDHSLPRNIENETNEERYKREGYLHGMYAFGLVEMNYFHEAEIVSRYSTQSSISNHLNDPWSHHTVAHALEEQGKVLEGIHFMENHSHYWADRNHFMRSHNWWHLSLYYLDKLQEEKVFELYHQHIFPPSNQSMLSEIQVQIGASALLWRLNLHNIEVGKRWEELEEKIDKEKMPLHPFIDLHFIYALAKGGQKEKVNEIFRKLDTEMGIDLSLDPFLLSPPSPSFPFSPPAPSPLFPTEHQFHFSHPFDQIDPLVTLGESETEKDERRSKREQDRNEFQKKIFVMIAKGVVHQAYGEYESAYRYLHPSIPFVSIIGGSNAQQDVWVQTYVDVLVNTQRWEEVNRILNVRTKRRPAAPHSFSLFAQSFLHLNDLPNYHLNLHQSNSLRSLYSSS